MAKPTQGFVSSLAQTFLPLLYRNRTSTLLKLQFVCAWTKSMKLPFKKRKKKNKPTLSWKYPPLSPRQHTALPGRLKGKRKELSCQGCQAAGPWSLQHLYTGRIYKTNKKVTLPLPHTWLQAEEPERKPVHREATASTRSPGARGAWQA